MSFANAGVMRGIKRAYHQYCDAYRQSTRIPADATDEQRLTADLARHAAYTKLETRCMCAVEDDLDPDVWCALLELLYELQVTSAGCHPQIFEEIESLINAHSHNNSPSDSDSD